MQIVSDQKVRVVPDVAVSGNANGMGLVEGLMGMMLRSQVNNGNGGSSTPPHAAPGK